MKYIPIGIGSCVPNYKKNSSGALLEINNSLYLIDCGTGILHTTSKTNYDYKDIKAVFVTHLHIDHINDLPSLLFAIKNDPKCNRKKDLYIFGPIGLESYYNKILDLYGETIISKNYEVKIRELSNSKIRYNNLNIVTLKTNHTKNSIGYRFEANNKIFCSSGDTGYNKNVVKLCNRADVAVLECSIPREDIKDIHLSPKEVGHIATEAKVNRVIINHLYPIMDTVPIKSTVKKIFSGKVAIAKIGKEYII